MYMGNATAKSRSDVARGDDIKNTRKYSDGSRQSKRKDQHSGGGSRANNSNSHKLHSTKKKKNMEPSLRESVLINEAHKKCPKGPPGRKCKEDIV